jgi:hypothetical protein
MERAIARTTTRRNVRLFVDAALMANSSQGGEETCCVETIAEEIDTVLRARESAENYGACTSVAANHQNKTPVEPHPLLPFSE